MINIFFRFWRIGSVIIISLVILFCYKSLPESIAVGHNDQGYPINFIGKQQFFYWAAGIVFFLNFLMDLLLSQIIKVDFKKIIPQSMWANHSTALKDLLQGWFSAFLALTNTYLIFVVLGLNNINSNKNQMLDFNYNWLLILGVVILMGLLFYLPLRILFTNPPKED
ncbi:hypothetical protein EGI22_09060 [Lacihabitans sp. LS3-19]|uniref:hypothetical protein n=1 Tax=Lacihabitans sp. LS3-19 TaxID=2487335 RepID=UPI0020CF62E3|nr:hypothetical protein [Lacihabitans sp. LS3-19]MCP9768061.1 hypothetical protein [Lacihabitans sp. LS3-19]